MSAFKLIALDLDGTTVRPDLSISPRVLRAVQRARESGLWVTVATGRNVASTRRFAAQLGINAPAICLQGGVIYDYQTERYLRHIPLPRDLACELVAIERAQTAWRAALYQGDRIYVTDGAFFGRIDDLVGRGFTVVPDLCAVLAGEDADKILFAVDPPQAPAALAHLRAIVGERAVVVQSHTRFVEVNPLGADKGAALQALAAHLGVAREAVMAIGDQGNDATMIAWAGCGVAMGNGHADLRAIADWVAPDIEADGAAIAIERFVLNGKCSEVG
jgi:Cof subfamily protein (haloacid dehalogenase superfamily)